MRKVLLATLVLLMAVSFAYAAKATQKDAIDLVNKAAAFLKANGEQKAFAEFNKKDGKFSDMSKELYVFVFDMTGKCLAHGANPGLIGRDLSGLKDNSGKFFIKDMVEKAKKGKGWSDYQWSNPVTKKIEPKSSYVLKVSNNMFVGCGIYK